MLLQSLQKVIQVKGSWEDKGLQILQFSFKSYQNNSVLVEKVKKAAEVIFCYSLSLMAGILKFPDIPLTF